MPTVKSLGWETNTGKTMPPQESYTRFNKVIAKGKHLIYSVWGVYFPFPIPHLNERILQIRNTFPLQFKEFSFPRFSLPVNDSDWYITRDRFPITGKLSCFANFPIPPLIFSLIFFLKPGIIKCIWRSISMKKTFPKKIINTLYTKRIFFFAFR